MRFSNITGQKRIKPLKRVFILQACLEMEIACVILFFMLRETLKDFRLKRNKGLSSAFFKVLMIQTFFMLTERTNYVLQELLRKKFRF